MGTLLTTATKMRGGEIVRASLARSHHRTAALEPSLPVEVRQLHILLQLLGLRYVGILRRAESSDDGCFELFVHFIPLSRLV